MADGKHESNLDRNGHKQSGYDHEKTKDVGESSGGQHSKDDRKDRDT